MVLFRVELRAHCARRRIAEYRRGPAISESLDFVEKGTRIIRSVGDFGVALNGHTLNQLSQRLVGGDDEQDDDGGVLVGGGFNMEPGAGQASKRSVIVHQHDCIW